MKSITNLRLLDFQAWKYWHNDEHIKIRIWKHVTGWLHLRQNHNCTEIRIYK